MTEKISKLLGLNDVAQLAKPVKIEFRLVLSPAEGRDSRGQLRPERNAHVEVFLDSQEFDVEVGWDLLAIVASGRAPGSYYLGNCGCGEPGCSGILCPFDVRHHRDAVTWWVPTPYVRWGKETPPPTMTVVSFCAMQYTAQSERLLADFRCAATDGGPPVRLNCYPGTLPLYIIEQAGRGWGGYGGKEPLPQ